MCQLLAMSCLQPASINFSLEGFHTRGGHTDEHKDGWGMAFFETDRPRLFHDHAPAAWSPLLQKVKSKFIKAKSVIAHIRKAIYRMFLPSPHSLCSPKCNAAFAFV